ncbi:hypothetical protein ASC94_10390 [Massilia sp. Root418]|uniref:ATPase domain-containing protein n=1 Tax=Massilia sp. Root418 TaxID=1736532 RepID=UPI0006FD531C|nr:ATPase domain-containing protein [Massilia sp. Root418]KQW97187.1 hypothetical protein ASC94_10390 [Massilia sp. Root418]
MKLAPISPSPRFSKALTGITGLDEMTDGGLPRGRTSLLAGGPGSGKTILALQFLVHGARDCGEPGIFVAFEETSERIVANANGFGWDLPRLQQEGALYFVNAQPAPDLVLSGNFDLGGMLAALEGQAGAMQAKRIVIDALDIVLALLPDAMSKRREIFRLHDWLLRHEMTAIVTAKTGDGGDGLMPQSFGFMQFMVDCSIVLNHSVVLGVSQRNLRVQK